MRWPMGIALGLAVVVAVNALMIWFALSDPPEVVPSYVEETR